MPRSKSLCGRRQANLPYSLVRGGGWGDDVHVCKSARGSREAPGVMCVPLSQSLEADGGDIYHKAGCGRGGAWGFRGVRVCVRAPLSKSLRGSFQHMTVRASPQTRRGVR